MIHYIVVVGSPTAVERLSPLLAPALRSTALLDVESIEHIGTSRHWAVAALESTDPTTATRLVVDGDSMVVANGLALLKGGDQQNLAPEILGSLRAGGVEAVVERLGGSYNLVGIQPGVGTRALSDFSGLSPLYWSQGEDFAIFSNRSTAARDLEGHGEWDLAALSWLIGHANLFGDALPAAGVRYLPPGLEARVPWGQGSASVERAATWTWPAGDHASGRSELTDDEWDQIVGELVANVRAVAGFRDRVPLLLSGGKDSRLCLALLKAAGLGDVVRAVTNGSPEHPDVVVASEVARAAGVPHRRASSLGGAKPGRRAMPSAARDSPATVPQRPARPATVGPMGGGSGGEADRGPWGRLRQAVYRYEAIVCPWDGATRPMRRTVVRVKGFGGELYRGPGGHAKQFKGYTPRSTEEMAEAFVNYHQIMDPLDVLRPEAAAFQADWLRDWVHRAASDVRLDLLPERFYIEHRLGHWNGPLAQCKPLDLVANPLLSPGVARKVYELSAEARASEPLHFEVMRRTAPELLAVPFVKDRWSDAILARSSLDLPRQGFGGPPPRSGPAGSGRRSTARSHGVVSLARRGWSERLGRRPKARSMMDPGRRPAPRSRRGGRSPKSWQWPFLQGHKTEIEALFDRAERETAMPEICDMDAVRRAAAATSDRSVNIEGKAMVSCVTVALALLGEAEPVHDG